MPIHDWGGDEAGTYQASWSATPQFIRNFLVPPLPGTP